MRRTAGAGIDSQQEISADLRNSRHAVRIAVADRRTILRMEPVPMAPPSCSLNRTDLAKQVDRYRTGLVIADTSSDHEPALDAISHALGLGD